MRTLSRSAQGHLALAAALVASVTLSGCLQGLPFAPPPREFTDEALTVTLSPLFNDLPYSLRMPVLYRPQSEYHGNALDVATIVTQLHVRSGLATVTLVNDSAATAFVWINGTGPVELWGETHLEMPTIEGTESYLQNTWSQPVGSRDAIANGTDLRDTLLVNATTNASSAFSLNLTVTYRGSSRLCGLDYKFDGPLEARPAVTAEWTPVPAVGYSGGVCA